MKFAFVLQLVWSVHVFGVDFEDCNALHSGWSCVTGLTSPLRIIDNDVECYSLNGKDCRWHTCPTLPPNDGTPLRCGQMHADVWGGNGYDDETHWCSEAQDMCPGCDELHSGWTCAGGISAPIRFAGTTNDVECYSLDGVHCQWGTCPTLPPNDGTPLRCGQPHADAWNGHTGYEDETHWCSEAQDLCCSDLHSGWTCVAGLSSPLRFIGDDVECYSLNGKDCQWGTCPTLPQNDGKPLICGQMHANVWGGNGYEDETHWCSQTHDMCTDNSQRKRELDSQVPHVSATFTGALAGGSVLVTAAAILVFVKMRRNRKYDAVDTTIN